MARKPGRPLTKTPFLTPAELLALGASLPEETPETYQTPPKSEKRVSGHPGKEGHSSRKSKEAIGATNKKRIYKKTGNPMGRPETKGIHPHRAVIPTQSAIEAERAITLFLKLSRQTLKKGWNGELNKEEYKQRLAFLKDFKDISVASKVILSSYFSQDAIQVRKEIKKPSGKSILETIMEEDQSHQNSGETPDLDTSSNPLEFVDNPDGEILR